MLGFTLFAITTAPCICLLKSHEFASSVRSDFLVNDLSVFKFD